MSWAGFTKRKDYELVISDQDLVGFFLAILFKLTGARQRHIVICHGKLAQPHVGRIMRLLRLQTHIHRFVCYGPAVAERLMTRLKIPSDQIVIVRHAADHEFWRPSFPSRDRLLVSAGMYNRDYETLVEAVRGLDIRVQIVAFSPWVDPRENARSPAAAPLPNVTFTKLNQPELRKLYSQALFIAVPLHDNDIQVGSLVVYEAMAMGKAVVVTRTKGQTALGLVREGETGFYVPEGDVNAWREAITYLTDHPEEALEMGRRARDVVEQGLNLRQYVEDMVGLVHMLGGGAALSANGNGNGVAHVPAGQKATTLTGTAASVSPSEKS